ncbi:MAG: DUF4423 domain-containing protein [Bacteriovoracia bacterium]
MTIYSHLDYKAFLKAHLARGEQKRFADHLRCQPAFLSQVLRGKPNLSLEQGILATDYFRLNRAETEYFMASLQYARAGSEKLRDFFRKKMDSLAGASKKVEAKIGPFSQVGSEVKAQFYSSWKYTLLHVLLSLPEKDQLRTIEKYTGLSRSEIQTTLTALVKSGVAEKKGDFLRPTANRIHLDREDPLIGLHHRNFRSLATHELEDIKSESLHYSAAIALSRADAERIRALFLEAVSQAESILRPSPEETVRVLCVDFFEPGR